MIDHMTKHSLLWSLDIGIRELKASCNRYTTLGKYTLFPVELLFTVMCILLGTVAILTAEVLDKLFLIHVSRAFGFLAKGLYGLFFKY